MGRPLNLPADFHEHNFLDLMKTINHGRHRIRLLAMHHIQSGESLKVVAKMVGTHWISIQRWLKRFKLSGFSGLYESRRSGAPRRLKAKEVAFISETVKRLSDKKTGGYITGKQLHQMLQDQYQVTCSLRTIYNTLHRLNFSWISSRSMHPKSCEAQQDAYKKTLPL